MTKKPVIEFLEFIKEGHIEGKRFFVFQNTIGEFRAIPDDLIPNPTLAPGTRVKALVRPKGCAGREIEAVYSLND